MLPRTVGLHAFENDGLDHAASSLAQAAVLAGQAASQQLSTKSVKAGTCGMTSVAWTGAEAARPRQARLGPP